jgi:hypothetical protein
METKHFDFNKSLNIEELESRQELSIALASDVSLEEGDAAAMARCKSEEEKKPEPTKEEEC